jgi:hypothetical protein
MSQYPFTRSWRGAALLPAALAAVTLLGGCGTIRVPLPAQALSFADPNSPVIITTAMDGTISGSSAGESVTLADLPPIGTGEVAGGSWGATAEVMAGVASNAYASLAQREVRLQDLAVKVAFYKAGEQEPACTASGFTQAAVGIGMSGLVTVTNGKYVVSSNDNAVSGEDAARLTTVLQQVIQKSREGGWLIKACASGRITIDGAAPPPGTTVRVTGLSARLQLNGVL